MKTNLLKSAVLVASLLGALSSASAETLHARIPFGFSAGGTAMPAGAYSISTIPGASMVLLFENEATKAQAIVFVRTDVAAAVKPATPLMFTSAGERAELVHIATDGWTAERSRSGDHFRRQVELIAEDNSEEGGGAPASSLASLTARPDGPLLPPACLCR
jgi:hypothetical protein